MISKKDIEMAIWNQSNRTKKQGTCSRYPDWVYEYSVGKNSQHNIKEKAGYLLQVPCWRENIYKLMNIEILIDQNKN